MTAHSKRDFIDSNSFEDCLNVYIKTTNTGFPRRVVEDALLYRWDVARENGIPEHMICKYLLDRLRFKQEQALKLRRGRAPTVFRGRY